jgi:hypothetical protein
MPAAAVPELENEYVGGGLGHRQADDHVDQVAVGYHAIDADDE